MFEMTGIAKSYGYRKILDGVELSVREGEPVCLFGPSGCGKTTLLSIAAGLTIPDEGKIINGKKSVSCVFQEDRLLPWCTAGENIMISARNREAASAMTEAAGLCEYLDYYPNEMSGGMRRRTAIARAAAFDGDIYILDEPFTGIDDERKEKICVCLRKLVRNKICLMASHDIRDAELMGAGILKIF